MTGYVTRTPWITVFKPGPSKVVILLVDDMLYILTLLHDLIRHHDATDAGANGEDLDFPRLGRVENDVRDDIAIVVLNRLVAICDLCRERVDVWGHDGYGYGAKVEYLMDVPVYGDDGT